MKVKNSERNRNILYSWVILMMFLIFSLAVIVGVKYWGLRMETRIANKGLFLNSAVTGVMAVIINIINYLLSYSIEILSDM
jgi:hypothetical protein